MELRTSRRTMWAVLGALAAGSQARAQGGAPSTIVIHGAGPTGTIARIAIQLNFKKPETWIYEIAGKSVAPGGARELLQNGIHNAHKPIADGFLLLRKQGEEAESRIAFSPSGIATLADVRPGHYAAVIEVPSKNMRLGATFRVTAEGFINEATLQVL